MTQRHKVFASYHHDNDQDYRNRFDRVCENVIVSRSVDIGDIDPELKTETIRRRIRDEYLRDSTVTVVLIGSQTWQRKHVDWEISSSIRATQKNPRSGLLGIFLPTHPDYGPDKKVNPYTIPPRLWDNVESKYAMVYDWKDDPNMIQKWIHHAYLQRDKVDPDNSRNLFGKNHSGPRWQ